MEIQKRIDVATTLVQYQELTNEVKSLFEGNETSEETKQIIFTSALALCFNSNRLLMSDTENEEYIAIRNIARRTALNAFNYVHNWMLKYATAEGDVRFIRSHLMNMTRDYQHDYMEKPEALLWGLLLLICLKRLVEMQSIVGCTIMINILNELGVKVPYSEEDQVQIRDMEFAQKNMHHIGFIIEFLQKNKINVLHVPLCTVTNETYERYTLTLQNIKMSGKSGKPGKSKKVESEIKIGKVQDANENRTACTRNVYYNDKDQIFYVYRDKAKFPVVPDVLTHLLMEKLKDSITSYTDQEREDALEMQKRVAELQEEHTDEAEDPEDPDE